MIPLKCVAIDDEPLALELIKTYVARFPNLSLISVFEDGLSALEYLNQFEVDLIFLDVNMPDVNGVDLAKSLNKKPMIIFTTAYRNYAFDGFELQAIDYLLKPIDFSRFSKAIEKAFERHTQQASKNQPAQEQLIYVFSEYKMIPIAVAEIEHIESMGDYLKIYQSNKDNPILTLNTMKKILEKLPSNQFARIHRSYIIALNKIQSIGNKKVKLKHIELPIGEAYKDFLNQHTN